MTPANRSIATRTRHRCVAGPGERLHPRSRVLHALLAVGLVVCVASCGQGGDGAGEAPPVRATDFLITADDLPAGWSDSNSQGTDYGVTVCGVDIEPAQPVRATSIRFSRGPLGPFLEQHVRVYEDGAAVVSGVIADLRQALPGCSQYTVRAPGPDGPTATFTVEPLTVTGAPEDSVAWRQVSRGELSITTDLLLLRRGGTAVMLMAYAIRGEPDPEVLERAVAAIPEVG